jgi:chromosome segregation ATPase
MNFSFRITEQKVAKDHETLKKTHPDIYKPQEALRDALKGYIRDFKDDDEIVDEYIGIAKEKINKLESTIRDSEEEVITLQKELKELEEWKTDIENNKMKGDDPIMRVINALNGLKNDIRKKETGGPSKNLLVKYARETHLKPETLYNMGMAYYLGDIKKRDIEKLTPISLQHLDNLKEFNSDSMARIVNLPPQTTLPQDIRS